MRRFNILVLSIAVTGLISSCKTVYQPQSVQYKDYRVNQQQAADSAIIVLLKPYSDSVNHSMNNVIAVAGMELQKKQPEGTLGNVLADAMLYMAKEWYQTKVDAAFINSGGIRLPSIAAGEITKGKIFELAPFDNILVLQTLSGKVLQEFLDLVAARGGWPCAGISYQIKDKKAINVFIDGVPLDNTENYVIANNDYVANGGDDCDMLRNIPQQNNGFLFRDAVLEYFSKLSKEGKQITGKIEKRVSYAE